jgi:hypothetical protein
MKKLIEITEKIVTKIAATALVAAAILAGSAGSATAANADGTPVDLNPITFTNLPLFVKGGYTSNLTAQYMQLPKNSAVTFWLSFKAECNTNTPGVVLADVVPTNTLVTNITVTFALGRTVSTNTLTTANTVAAKTQQITMTGWQSASNFVVWLTNFSATTLAGAQYITPVSIQYPSSATNHCITNLSLIATYPR